MTAPVLLLGHGASGTSQSMLPWVRALDAHGIRARSLDLPRGNAERAAERFLDALDSARCAIGGHSYGGRAASLAAASAPVAGLVLLSYPLHRPGHADDLRTSHWPSISCPVLVLSGERDPFARVDLLRQEVLRLRSAELVTYAGQGHGLLGVIDDAVQHIARFIRTQR